MRELYSWLGYATRGLTMDNSTVKTAVIQAGPILFDTPRALEKLADLTRDASAQGADLMVFPEAFIGGRPVS